MVAANNLEIERKWRVLTLPAAAETGQHLTIEQAYIINTEGACLRVRTVTGAEDSGFITVKGPSPVAGAIAEFEMPIPLPLARTLMAAHTGPTLSKTRIRIPYQGLTIELDVFSGPLSGLLVAEVEFPVPDAPFTPPDWFGPEVTGDRRYTNANLIDTMAIPSL